MNGGLPGGRSLGGISGSKIIWFKNTEFTRFCTLRKESLACAETIARILEQTRLNRKIGLTEKLRNKGLWTNP
jgi:hypothetical protein